VGTREISDSDWMFRGITPGMWGNEKSQQGQDWSGTDDLLYHKGGGEGGGWDMMAVVKTSCHDIKRIGNETVDSLTEEKEVYKG